MALTISRRAGVLDKDVAKEFFLAIAKQTSTLARLDMMESTSHGEFDRFSNDETNAVFTGFALGMRCFERLCIASGVDSKEPIEFGLRHLHTPVSERD